MIRTTSYHIRCLCNREVSVSLVSPWELKWPEKFYKCLNQLKLSQLTAAPILDTLNATVGWLRAGSDSVTSDELLGSGEVANTGGSSYCHSLVMFGDQQTLSLWLSRHHIGWHNLTHRDKQNRKSPCTPGGPSSHHFSHTSLSASVFWPKLLNDKHLQTSQSASSSLQLWRDCFLSRELVSSFLYLSVTQYQYHLYRRTWGL